MSVYLQTVQWVNNHFNDNVLSYCDCFFRWFNLNHFWHYKLTNDGYISFIGSHADWTEYFASEEFFRIYPQLRHPKFIQQGVHLHRDAQDQSLKKIYDTCGQKYGMQQSVVFVNKTSEGVEEFGFSTDSLSEVQTSLFLNEIPLFRYFIGRFKEENQVLLSKLEDNRVNLAEIIGPSFYHDTSPNPKNNEILALLKKMGLEIGEPLTTRECEVSRLLLRGFSASKIAPQVYLSKRTVEHHIERIKDKLRCDSKAELIQKAREMEQFGLLNTLGLN